MLIFPLKRQRAHSFILIQRYDHPFILLILIIRPHKDSSITAFGHYSSIQCHLDRINVKIMKILYLELIMANLDSLVFFNLRRPFLEEA